MADDFVFNGINAVTGEYLAPRLNLADIVSLAKGERLEPDHLRDLRHRFAQGNDAVMGIMEGIDPLDLGQAGWGVIFPSGGSYQIAELKHALRQLLNWRCEQAGSLYREFLGADGYQANESKNHFLARHGAAPGPVDPQKVPYYLLIVGSPEDIPFGFQYQLSVQHAVGRIHFETLEEYANYARSVVSSEHSTDASRRAAFFSVANPNDAATKLSSRYLVEPLSQALQSARPNWQFQKLFGPDATKSAICSLLQGRERPSLLFTASHGLGFPIDHPDQKQQQGALLCQDWPGPVAWPKDKSIPKEFFFSAEDLKNDLDLSGMITFHFACFGAGTPQLDEFAFRAYQQRVVIARAPFIARLPQRFLGLRSGALAAVGHIERAWGYSFLWEDTGSQVDTFTSAFYRIMEGMPVGHALEYFSGRYAELSTMLSDVLDEVKFGKIVDDRELAKLWTANNDARNYIIIGDPAVRLSS